MKLVLEVQTAITKHKYLPQSHSASLQAAFINKWMLAAQIPRAGHKFYASQHLQHAGKLSLPWFYPQIKLVV